MCIVLKTITTASSTSTTTTKTTIHSSLGRIRNFLCTREMLLSYVVQRLRTSILQQFQTQNKYLKSSRYCQCTKKIIQFKLSDIGEGIDEVILKEWHVSIDDFVDEFDNICDVQSDKALVTISSRYRGKITKLYYNVEDVIKIGSSLIDVEIDAGNDRSKKSESSASRTKILASPTVRKLIKDNTIDSKTLVGSGEDGRILKDDVLKQIKKPQTSRSRVENTKTSGIQPLSSIQKTMAKKMTAALNIPHFVYSDEINVTKLLDVRNELCNSLDTKFTLMPLFLKALSNALIKYPILNSSIDANCENIHFKNEHNIGVASDTSAGLVVPVIRNVQNLSIFEISDYLNQFRELSANNKWSNYDLSDGTITFSNIGNIGGTYLKPIILPPQVAIGAIGRIFKKNEQSYINVSWSADHRVLDGATVAKFSNLWKKQLENPILLMSNYYQKF